MTREEKSVIIDEPKEKFSQNQVFYVTDAQGMSVEQINNFRRLCFNKGIEYKVYKNTLIAKALADKTEDYTEFNDKVLAGASGVLFAAEDGKAPAQLLKEFYKTGDKKNPRPVFKGASVSGGLFIGQDQLEVLTTIKNKQELIGEVIGLLQSPAKNVISALKGSGQKIAGLIKTLSEREG